MTPLFERPNLPDLAPCARPPASARRTTCGRPITRHGSTRSGRKAGSQKGQRLGALEVSEDKELCCKASEPPRELEVTSDELTCPSAVTGTFASGADGPDLARVGSPGATIPGRSRSMAGKEAQAEEAVEVPKGLCPDEADRPEGPSLAPIGR